MIFLKTISNFNKKAICKENLKLQFLLVINPRICNTYSEKFYTEKHRKSGKNKSNLSYIIMLLQNNYWEFYLEKWNIVNEHAVFR
jgi:hypothetical protein